MKTKLLLSFCCLLCIITAAAANGSLTGTYKGELTINLGGPGEPENKSIDIFDNGNGTITFVLPDFVFGGAIDLGSIVLLDVPAAEGQLSLDNYPLNIPALGNMEVKISITAGSVFAGENLTANLSISVPGIGEVPVTFTGTRSIAAAEGAYQVRGSGFEGEWDKHDYTNTLNKTITGYEPRHWNSFMTAGGTLANIAKDSTQLRESSLVRPGSAGLKSALITSRYVLIKKANGNLTTGKMNASSMEVTKPVNHNASDPLNGDDFICPFIGAPDSLRVWVKYRPADGDINNPENQASLSATIHNSSRYQDPEDGSGKYDEVKTAQAKKVYAAVEDYGWQCLSVPFEYSWLNMNQAENILISFSTNAVPGGGTTTGNFSGTITRDSIWIDDLEMIYNSELSALSVGGETAALQQGVYSYKLEQEFDDTAGIIAAADGKGASVITAFNRAAQTAAVIVKGGSFAADPANTHTYTLSFTGTTGQQAPPAQQTSVFTNGRTLYIVSPSAAAVEIFTIDGRLITTTSSTVIQMPSAGVYVVRINGRNHKTIIR